MGKKTGMITYNVHNRGRKALGVDRHFDTVALAALINGPATQEKVKLGDMLGYFGHWPRVKFGMATQEGGILDGKAVSLPVAIRTTFLSADNEGNITHQAEFLDTNEGRMAERMYDSNAGGFSSAIDAVPRTKPSIPTEFYAMDFVAVPNYDGNRGYRAMLDAVASVVDEEREEMFALLDAVAEESNIAMNMFDALHRQHMVALETLTRVTDENDLLVGRLAMRSANSPVLDAIMGEGRLAPMRGTVTNDFDRFRSEPLVPLQVLKEEKRSDNSPEANALRHYGMKD